MEDEKNAAQRFFYPCLVHKVDDRTCYIFTVHCSRVHLQLKAREGFAGLHIYNPNGFKYNPNGFKLTIARTGDEVVMAAYFAEGIVQFCPQAKVNKDKLH